MTPRAAGGTARPEGVPLIEAGRPGRRRMVVVYLVTLLLLSGALAWGIADSHG